MELSIINGNKNIKIPKPGLPRTENIFSMTFHIVNVDFSHVLNLIFPFFSNASFQVEYAFGISWTLVPYAKKKQTF